MTEKTVEKCHICKHKTMVKEVDSDCTIYDCDNCGLFIEETALSTLVDFPKHNMIFIESSMPRKEINRSLFNMNKRFKRARKAYRKSYKHVGKKQ